MPRQFTRILLCPKELELTAPSVVAHRRNLKKGAGCLAGKGLYANIQAKRKRIANGSGERMRKAGSKGAPTAKNFKRSARTAQKT